MPKSPDFNPAAMQGDDLHKRFQLPQMPNPVTPPPMQPPIGGMFARPSTEAIQYASPLMTGGANAAADVVRYGTEPFGRSGADNVGRPIEPPRQIFTPPAPSSDPVAGMEAVENQQRMNRTLGSMEQINRDVNALAVPQEQLAMPETVGGLIPQREVGKVFIPKLPGEQRPDIDPRDNPLLAARYDYMSQHQGDDGKFKRDWKNALQNALLGASEGIKAAGGNPWGALSGAVAGGAGTIINPQAGREFTWDAAMAPKVAGQIADTQKQQDRNRAIEMDALRKRGIEGDLERDAAMAKLREAQANRPYPKVGDASWGTYNLETGEPIFQRPQGQSSVAAPRRYRVGDSLVDESGNVLFQGQGKPEKPISLTEAEAEESANEGDVESIAQDSLQGRLDSLRQRLTPQERRIVSGEADDDPEITEATRVRAMNRWQGIQEKELAGIRREVQGRRKANAQSRRSGGGQRSGGSMSGQAAQPRNMDDLMKYLQ